MLEELTNAVILHRSGKIQEALTRYLSLLKRHPHNADVLHLTGLALHQLGDTDEALEYLKEACVLKPDNGLFAGDYGSALASLGMHDAAETQFVRALTRDPHSAIVQSGLAALLRKKGDMAGAANHYTAAAQLKPCFGAFFNAGLAHHAAGNFSEAIPNLEQALEFTPGDMAALRYLGLSLHGSGQSGDGIAKLLEAAAAAPDNADLLYDLGVVYHDIGVLSGAIEWYRKVLALTPDHVMAAANLGEALLSSGAIDPALETLRTLVTRQPDCSVAHSTYLLALNYRPDSGRGEVFAAHQRWGATVDIPGTHAPKKPHTVGTIKIGYVSPDFREHSVMRFLLPVLAHHRREQVDVFLYSNTLHTDDLTARIREMGTWRDISNQSDDDAAECIRQDGIDVLVDLAGHTANNRLGIFARRPAPVQVTWCGYPNTTGLTSIDYRIGDTIADPEGSKAFYTEQLYRIDGCFLCYGPLDTAPECAGSPCDRNGFVTFGSFNTVAKLSDATIRMWRDIMHRLPTARLYLKSRFYDDAALCTSLREKFTIAGVPPQRLTLAGHIAATAGHLAAYGQIDIGLDTYPYNGATTTCEALWMGVPVITRPGDRHVSRVGASLLSAVGLSDCIANDAADYVEKAVRLASDTNKLKTLRQGLRAAMAASVLCDADGFVRKLEKAYRDMCARK